MMAGPVSAPGADHADPSAFGRRPASRARDFMISAKSADHLPHRRRAAPLSLPPDLAIATAAPWRARYSSIRVSPPAPPDSMASMQCFRASSWATSRRRAKLRPRRAGSRAPCRYRGIRWQSRWWRGADCARASGDVAASANETPALVLVSTSISIPWAVRIGSMSWRVVASRRVSASQATRSSGTTLPKVPKKASPATSPSQDFLSSSSRRVVSPMG